MGDPKPGSARSRRVQRLGRLFRGPSAPWRGPLKSPATGSVRGSPGAAAVVLTLVGVLSALSPAPASAHADSFVRRLAERALTRGLAQEARGDIAQALTSYDEAVRADDTFGPALMRLAGLRERLGAPDEAELLYTRATALPGTQGDAFYARALLRNNSNRRQQATLDLAQAVELSGGRERLRLLGAWYVEARAWPAALAVWRAVLADAETSGDAAQSREARLTVSALSWLAIDTDPVLAGTTSPDWTRRSLARAARRAASPVHGVRKLTP